jgi:uncharacterized protein (TIGR03086 family)
MNDVVAAINAALDTTATIVGTVPAAAWHEPTPCSEWDVHQVANHLVGGLRIFTGELTGAPAGADHDSDWLGTDAVAAYLDAAAADRAAWARPDALAGTITIGLGTLPAPLAAVIHLTEVLVHGVDIAVAIGRDDLVDQHQCTGLLSAMQQMGGVDAYRMPGVFGPQAPTTAADPAHRQLLAYLGREMAPARPSTLKL